MAKKWISLICVWVMVVTIFLMPLTVRTVGAQSDSGNEAVQEEGSQQTGNADLIQAPSGVLMEAQTGTVIFGKDKVPCGVRRALRRL